MNIHRYHFCAFIDFEQALAHRVSLQRWLKIVIKNLTTDQQSVLLILLFFFFFFVGGGEGEIVCVCVGGGAGAEGG